MNRVAMNREAVRQTCTGLALALLIGAFWSTAAHGHDGDDHGMPMGAAEATEAEPVKGRQLCSFRPGVHKAGVCGTKNQVKPAPPLMGKMMLYEADSFTGVEPTETQQQAADEMVASCTANVGKRGWEDIEKALADGYEPAWNDSVHYVNRGFVFDKAFMDCEKPEYLMFYDSPTGKVLAGLMFVTQALEDEGPQPGGPLTRWHFHYWATPRCLDRGVLATGLAAFGECDEGVLSFRSPEMLHVWLFDHPHGRFSAMMHLSDDAKAVLMGEEAPAE